MRGSSDSLLAYHNIVRVPSSFLHILLDINIYAIGPDSYTDAGLERGDDVLLHQNVEYLHATFANAFRL